MTLPPPDEDEDSPRHLVIHWDAGAAEAIAPDEAPEEEPPRPPLFQRYKYWLYALVLLLVATGTAYAIGEATYHPAARLPVFGFETTEALYGTNPTIEAELDLVRDAFAQADALQLEPEGRAYHLPLPRTVADRLFGERDESITVFGTRSPAGEHRFLVLSTGDSRTYAIEAPLGLSRRDSPGGVFLALDPADPRLAPLVAVLEALRPAIDDLPSTEVSPDDYYAFGPYQAGDADSLRTRIEASIVMTHLAEAIAAADGGVSLVAPVILIGTGPSRGTINAIYHPARRAVMEPLWGASSTGSLAHELVHAYIDTVVANESEVLTAAADYLERAHPVLHGEVVGDLYQRLDREGRAEESLAFITGAIAARQTKTVATQRLLENPGNLQISEAVLYADIDLLVRFGILPACMLPPEGARGELRQSYYEEAEAACR